MNKRILALAMFVLAYTPIVAQYNNITVWNISLLSHNYTDTPIVVIANLFNNTPDTIRTVSFLYTINNGTPVKATLVNDTIVPYHDGYISHPVPIVISTEGSYYIKVWVDSINGIPDTLNNNDDTVNVQAHFYPAASALHKRVLLQEFTGAWCGWCSGGAVNTNYLADNDSDLIAVAIHNGDSMVVSAGSALYPGCGFPSVNLDRFMYFNKFSSCHGISQTFCISPLESIIADRKKMASPVNVSISNQVYDSLTRTLTADVNAEFLNNLYTGDYRINLLLTEDSLTGNGYGWDQNNYSFSHLNPSAVDTTSILFPLPTWLTCNGLPGGWAHNHVLRKMAGGTNGTAGIIPTAPTSGSIYTKNYSFVLPQAWDPAKISLVGLVLEHVAGSTYNYGTSILNSVKVPLQLPTATTFSDPELGTKDIVIYPDPALDLITLQINSSTIKKIKNVQVKNTFGQTVINDLSGNHKVNVSHLIKGMYVITVETENNLYIQKFLKN